ncbi:hypothetical protein DLAC_07736 [Tieghemostelium lacteum]|uniref:Uncharacterized protein n=1 Tax=Tieghemostelium lacteum TaxID=361077 RepID=A0A151ZA91_TIELA|nr:hypothetical protein DLAC_07736 [Tieghemostelium lacteum]|eukprot:KYQ90865.1 hypothetical protein DLAC_07736 [Tieghemostelium lacteum]
MDAIVTKMEETLERKKSITLIVEKRSMAIDYIRRIHEAAYYSNTGTGGGNGGFNTTHLGTSGAGSSNSLMNGASSSTSSLSSLVSSVSSSNNNNSSSGNINSQRAIHWMNVAQIQKSDLEKSTDIQKRLLGWFCLGLSLAPLTTTDKGPAYVRSLVQLMEEYDYHFELGSAMQGVKVLLSKKQPTHTVVNENEHIKSKIMKIGNTVVYEFLKIFNISMAKDLDYFHVVFSLLEILELIYKKFDKETCSSKYVYEALLKVDSRLKHHIFGFLSKEIDKISTQIIREQLEFTILCTSIKDKDIQQSISLQSKLANSLSSSNSSVNNNNINSSSNNNNNNNSNNNSPQPTTPSVYGIGGGSSNSLSSDE